ncbi:phage distal tail protein [Streptosporangium canum]|uniref:phage distal tail protein n=1 Tax=Streptosporangium canum TaxID=324952 RepID=UPI0037B41559
MAGELITQSWQVEWDGFLLGTSTAYRIQQLDGWEDLPGLDMGAAAKPSRPGSWPGRTRAQSRIVTLSLQVIPGAGQMAEAMRSLRAATAVSADASEAALAIRLHDETFLAFGKISGRVIPVNHAYSQGFAPAATLQWLCADPRRYALAEQSVTIGAPTGGSGGLTYPITYPLVYGVAATPSNATCTNTGDTPTNPTLVITGPITTPRVVNSTLTRAIEFDIDLAAGQTLVVDTDRGTVLLDGVTDRLYTRTNFSVPVEHFELAPGDNNLTLVADAFGSGAQVSVTWRSASM